MAGACKKKGRIASAPGVCTTARQVLPDGRGQALRVPALQSAVQSMGS